MRVGDIVRLKPEHYLNEFIKGDCRITQVIKGRTTRYQGRKTRYHIKNNGDRMTWVHLEDLDLVSDLRNQRLESLGI